MTKYLAYYKLKTMISELFSNLVFKLFSSGHLTQGVSNLVDIPSQGLLGTLRGNICETRSL